MAITAATQLSDFSGFLNREQSAPIFEDVTRKSIVQRLAKQVPLGASGKSVAVVTSRPVGYWTAEGVTKGGTKGGMSLVNMDPKKLAAIAVVSSETFRANPGGYMDWLRPALAESFAVAFDYAALYDLGGDGTGTGPFDHHIEETTKAVEFGTGTTIYTDLVSGLDLLVQDDKRLTGFAFGPIAEPILLDAVDTTNRPILAPSTAEGVYANMLGRPLLIAEGVNYDHTMGFGGNWAKAAWGVVGGINYAVSTEASVTINGALVSAFENNLVVVRAEAEYGFVVEDVENWVRYTEASVS